MEERTAIYSDLTAVKHEIRLLVIHPDPDHTSTVQGTLEVVSLNKNPAYEALSYAWEAPTMSEHIYLHGQELKVTMSAVVALRALRFVDKPRTIWIDAICIDQSNLDERSAQVKLMGLIYQKAESVRVWLGLEPHNSDRVALSILKEMGTPEGVEKRVGREDEYCWETTSIMYLLQRPWWRRLWVVQEAALGRHVVFQLGSEELTFRELLVAYQNCDAWFGENLRNMRSYSMQPRRLLEDLIVVKVLEQAHVLAKSTTCNGPAGTSERKAIMAWCALASLLRNREVSVVEDRLYALFSLLPPTILQNQEMQPSYSSNTRQVFTDVTYSLMKSSESLMMFNFLYEAEVISDGTPLPSWVPDWQGPFSGGSNLSHPPPGNYDAHSRVARDELFCAAGDSLFYLQRHDFDTICLKGAFVNSIQAVHQLYMYPKTISQLRWVHKNWWGAWENSGMSTTYFGEKSSEAAFRKTMLWDCQPGNQPAELVRLTDDEEAAMFEARKLTSKSTSTSLRKIISAADGRRTRHMMNCARKRIFFVTRSGLIGLAPMNIRTGDHIFVIAGNSHPVVLRPSAKYADTWNAVGEW